MVKRFDIYAWPAFVTKKLNPYNYLIYCNIEKQGYTVQEFIFRSKELLKIIFSKKLKILHLHWPRRYVLFDNSSKTAMKRLIAFCVFIKIFKFLNGKVVWTVHNLESHNIHYPALENYINNFLYKHVDGFISMNEKGLDSIREKAKYIPKKKFACIPHPHYKHYYLNEISKEEARAKLNISINSFVFLFLGQIKLYKNLPALLKAFNSLNNDNKLLLIAGNLDKDVPLSEELLKDSNIKFYNRFIKEDDLQIFFNAADLVVTPYKKVFNSGSIFLNLSFNKPTLAPAMYAFEELQKKIGSYWIKTYEGELSSEILEKGMKEVIEEKSESLKPDLKLFDPEAIALKTINFYKILLNLILILLQIFFIP